VSKDDGATFAPAAVADSWGPGGFGAAGHIEVKFSPMYNGSNENNAYAGTTGTLGADDMYRGNVASPAPWERMAMRMGAAVPIANFEIVRHEGIVGDALSQENILYALVTGTGQIAATYYPEFCSRTAPLWRFDLANAPTIWHPTGNWGLAGPMPSGLPMPCPFDAIVGASVTLHVVDTGTLPWASVANTTETTAFLTPIGSMSPAEGAIVPSNNTATGEPVELQFWPVPGATDYDVVTVTDISNPATILGAGSVNDNFATTGSMTEFSIPVGSLVDGQTYWWRTRVSSTTGGPAVLSGAGTHTGPWSGWHSFTIQSVEIHMAPTLHSPASGEVSVPVMAMFRWSVIEDVVSTQFQLANDGAFTDIIEEVALGAEQTYASQVELDESTTYHWRVRGSGGTGIDAWTTPWSEGIFTSRDPEPEPTPPVIVQEGDTVIIEEADTDTPGWVWALIVIGAVLAVVVIVLIMRTRRPA
jgi:hypothetical protein